MALPAVGTSQQGPQDPPRSDYVFHIYVSPLYGDNARATALNPSTSPTGAQLMPLDRHPQPPDANNIKPITGFLNHAPYPFKTLTRSNGALAWIDANFRPGSPPFFPWTNSSTERRVTHVVVHCLPGLYGPAQIGVVPSPIDPATALPWNGEEWPAIIRDRVSIQGTSALDTIFDARGEPDGTTPPVLVVNEDRGPLESSYFTHQQSFIDSVQIRGGRVPLESTTAPVGSGAGIYVHGRRPNQQEFAISRIRITNCVFTDNIVGVGLDGYWLGDYPSMVDLGHRPMIVNNTFAWNRCGLWCGSTAVRPISDPFRNLLSYPVLINNIFDSGSPSWAITGVTGFEGVKPEDKQIRAVLSPPVLLQAAGDGVDFNAWEDSADPPNPPYVNLGNSGMFAVAAIWPRVDVSTSGSVVWFGPRVDLTPFTKSGSPRACSLYVNDIFRNSPEGGTGFEYSRYDFRLAPNVNTTTSPPGSVNPPPRNPLVNQGIEAAQPDGTMLFPITPANGEILIDEPGLPLGAEESRVDGWDWDGEGFGNPRSEARQGFATGTFGQSQEFVSHMDLGFDEMGPLIMAGYLASTRSFVKLSVAQGGVTLPDRGRIFYFNLMTGGTPPPPASYPRPLANAPFGIGEGWYQHVQAGVDLEDLNYTKLYVLGPGSLRRFTAQSPPPWHFSSIPRALRCDFSPSLLLDPHSEWGRLLVHPPIYTSEDPYAANPWHDDLVGVGLKSLNNPALFHNLGGTIHNDVSVGTKGLFGLKATAVLDATINPPGASVLGGGAYVIPPTAPFGPWTPCGGAPGAPYTVGTWGYGDAQLGCPDVIPYFGSGSDFLGIRYNCQVGTADSNLQTFLAIRDAGQGAEASAGEANLRRLPRQATLLELLDHNTRASLLLEQRWRDGQKKR